MKLEAVKKMLEQKVPTAEIIQRSGLTAQQLVIYRRAWGIHPYGTPGPKGKTDES